MSLDFQENRTRQRCPGALDGKVTAGGRTPDPAACCSGPRWADLRTRWTANASSARAQAPPRAVWAVASRPTQLRLGGRPSDLQRACSQLGGVCPSLQAGLKPGRRCRRSKCLNKQSSSNSLKVAREGATRPHSSEMVAAGPTQEPGGTRGRYVGKGAGTSWEPPSAFVFLVGGGQGPRWGSCLPWM